MAENVSLEKSSNVSNAQMNEINEKLNFLISEVVQLKKDMNHLQSKNDNEFYRFDSQFRSLCSDLKDHIYKLKSTVYDGNLKLSERNYELTKEIQELQRQTSYSKFVDKLLPLSPIVLAGGTVWLIFLYSIFR